MPGVSFEGGVSVAPFQRNNLGSCLLSGRETLGSGFDLFGGSCKTDGHTGFEAGVTRAVARDSAGGHTLGVGLQLVARDVTPYAEAYAQMRSGPRAWGVGARVGIPTQAGWAAHAITVRADRPRAGKPTLTMNSSVLLQHGVRRRSDQLDGHWVGFSNALGLTSVGKRRVSALALHVTVGRARGVHPFAAPPADPDCESCPGEPLRFDGELTLGIAMTGSVQIRRARR